MNSTWVMSLHVLIGSHTLAMVVKGKGPPHHEDGIHNVSRVNFAQLTPKGQTRNFQK